MLGHMFVSHAPHQHYFCRGKIEASQKSRQPEETFHHGTFIKRLNVSSERKSYCHPAGIEVFAAAQFYYEWDLIERRWL